MSQSTIFIDIDQPPSAPIQVQLGQTLVLVRRVSFGGKFLHRLELPPSNFEAQPVANHGLTPFAGQPANTHVVAVATAQRVGTGSILIQFAPPNPAYPPEAPSSLAFLVS